MIRQFTLSAAAVLSLGGFLVAASPALAGSAEIPGLRTIQYDDPSYEQPEHYAPRPHYRPRYRDYDEYRPRYRPHYQPEYRQPRCHIEYRTVRTYHGYEQKPYRVCY